MGLGPSWVPAAPHACWHPGTRTFGPHEAAGEVSPEGASGPWVLDSPPRERAPLSRVPRAAPPPLPCKGIACLASRGARSHGPPVPAAQLRASLTAPPCCSPVGPATPDLRRRRVIRGEHWARTPELPLHLRTFWASTRTAAAHEGHSANPPSFQKPPVPTQRPAATKPHVCAPGPALPTTREQNALPLGRPPTHMRRTRWGLLTDVAENLRPKPARCPTTDLLKTTGVPGPLPGVGASRALGTQTLTGSPPLARPSPRDPANRQGWAPPRAWPPALGQGRTTGPGGRAQPTDARPRALLPTRTRAQWPVPWPGMVVASGPPTQGGSVLMEQQLGPKGPRLPRPQARPAQDQVTFG